MTASTETFFPDRYAKYTRDHPQHHRFVAEAIARIAQIAAMGGDQTVLEVGAGTGADTEVLLEHLAPGGVIDALELSAGMLDQLRTAIHDPRLRRTVCGDAADLGTLFAGHHYQRIVCTHSYFMFDAPDAFLAGVARCLKAGGRLVYSIPGAYLLGHAREQERIRLAQAGLVLLDAETEVIFVARSDAAVAAFRATLSDAERAPRLDRIEAAAPLWAAEGVSAEAYADRHRRPVIIYSAAPRSSPTPHNGQRAATDRISRS